MRSTSIAAALGLALASASAGADDTLRIVVRAFIPNAHPANPGYVRPVPGQQGKFMIPDPTSPTRCYSTDHRGFSSAPDASARVATDLTLVATSAPRARPSSGSAAHKAGITVEYECASGRTLRTATADVAGCHVGTPAHADGKVQLVFGCSGKNPLAPPRISPKIDYGATITYDIAKKTLAYSGDIGVFPAFEAYASLNGGPFVKLYASPPSAASVWWLYDGGLGINTRRVEVKGVALAK
jgi:hypothetical protein